MAEVEEGKKYWLGEFSLPVLLGIDTTWTVPDTSKAAKGDTSTKERTKRVDPRYVTDLRIFGYPTFYLIDRSGILRQRFMGWDEKRITAAVTKLLGETASGTAPGT